MTLTRDVVDATKDERWADLVGAIPTSVFASPPWLRVLSDTYGFEVTGALLLNPDGTPVAGMSYVDVADMMDPRVVSLPFSDFCDPVAATWDQWDQLIAPLTAETNTRIRLRCLFNSVPGTDPRFTEVSRAKWHGIDLSPGAEGVWESIAGSARRAVRKARTQGVEVRRASTLDDVRAFYDLHLKIRKYKYGLLPQPFRFFEAIWEHILEPGAGALLLAVHEDVVVGGVLYLEWQDTLYYKFNASNIDTLEVRPNDLLIVEGIAYAQDRGLRTLDFGLTDWDQDGLLRYKRKYATDERTIHFLEYRDGEQSSGDREMRALLPRLTEVLVQPEIPDGVTERAADYLYRYFL